MRLTARRLNRATLARQLLLGREPLAVAEGVRRVVALQAQEAASPYLALWNRLAPFDPAGLDAAFADHAVIKATLMRITLHAVAAADYPPFHRAMAESLRASRLYDRRYKQTGLSAADADALIPHLMEYTAERRTNAECAALLNARLGADQPRAWWALRTFAPVVHAVTGGPWSFGYRPSYLAAPFPDRAPDGREACVQRLAWRYLEGFGPASAADLARFTLLTRSAAREALDAMAGRLERLEGPDGGVLYDVPGAPRPGEDTPCPPRLMAMWDSVLLAYADHSRIIPAAYRALVTRRNGDVLPTLLVDGHVAGVWRPAGGGIEVTAFHQISERAWQELSDEACALVSFLAARDPAVYRRYAHWWKELPAAEVRVLPG